MDKNNPTEGGFSGIKKGLRNLFFTEEYLESRENNSPPAQQVKPTSNSQQVVSVESSTETQKVMDKMYSYIESLNQPGIDFWEFWNAVEEMGGVTEQNLNNAFKALRVVAGKTLTVQSIVESGLFYKTKLEEAVNADVSKKDLEKQNLLQAQSEEKNRLAQEVLSLQEQVKELNAQLSVKQDSLAKIDNQSIQKIKELDDRISIGKNASAGLLAKIQTVLDLTQKIK